MKSLTYRQKAELALGRPLARRNEVHHVDGNRGNDDDGNLVICEDRAYHLLLHKRAKRPSDRTFPVNVSIDRNVLKPALQRAEVMGFKFSFSAYVTKLILDDLENMRPVRKQAKA